MWLIDRLQNVISGLGTAKDKSTGNAFIFSPISAQQLEAAYRSDWIARKVVDIIPSDMTREWRSWKAEEGHIEALEATEQALGVKEKVGQATKLARLYGGSAIIIGDGAQDTTSELRIDAMGRGSIKYLHVFSRYDLNVGEMDRDLQSPWFGTPSYYDLQADRGGRVRLHPSRVVRFIGSPVPDAVRISEPWGDSILQALFDAIMQATATPQHVAALLPEAKTDIISIPGLSEILSTTEGTTKLTARMQNASLMKSMFNVMLLDAAAAGDNQGELWQQKQLSFTGFPELIHAFLQIAAGAADIPVTRLLGQSPAGLSATGAADLRNYYDHVAARQENELRPAIARLDEALIRHALGSRPAGVNYVFEPLWQLGEKEKADIAKLTAETASIYIRDALVPADVLAEGVKSRLIDDGVFPGIEAAYDAIRTAEPDEDEAALLAREEETAIVRRLNVAANDAEPRPLYVRRDVKNGAAIVAWAKGQGFTTTLDADDMHVTITYSRQPLDWMTVGESYESEIKIAAGGPRMIEQFGEATVLLIPGRSLKWRHEEMKEAGASWDHDEYQPHITISYGGAPADLSAVKPYQGEIVLGPEIFEDLDEDWKAKVTGE